MSEREKPHGESGKAKLMLAVHKNGFVVLGDTYGLKETLKSEGGKWDSMAKGWVFPLLDKASLKDKLSASGEVGIIEDAAIVKLTLEPCERGILVAGETFQMKELLKSHGGVWDPTLKSWVFKATQKGELLGGLLASGAADVAIAKGAGNNGTALVATPLRSLRGLPQAHGDGTKFTARLPLAAQPSASRKVVDSDRQLRRVERSVDGAQAETRIQHRERKVSCKRTGAHIETQSVTKRKKVVEKKGKIVETATITVRRVRPK